MSPKGHKRPATSDGGYGQATKRSFAHVIVSPAIQNRGLPFDKELDDAKRCIEILRCPYEDVKSRDKAFTELSNHYESPRIIQYTFSQETLDTIMAHLSLDGTSEETIRIQVLALYVLNRIAKHRRIIDGNVIVKIEAFLQSEDFRLRAMAVQILATSADGKPDQARFILNRPGLLYETTRCMARANAQIELKCPILATAVLCRESANLGISPPMSVAVEVCDFLGLYYDRPDFLSKELLKTLLEVLVSLLRGPPEQVEVIAADGNVRVLLFLILKHYPKRFREPEIRAVTTWSLKCLRNIANDPVICGKAFGDRLPDVADLLTRVISGGPETAVVEAVHLLTDMTTSCPSFVAPLIQSKGRRLVQALLDAADMEEDHGDEVVGAGIRALSKIIHHGTEAMVKFILRQGVDQVFKDFICRGNHSDVGILSDMLHSIEIACNFGWRAAFDGWDDLHHLATSFHDPDVAILANKLYWKFSPNEQLDSHRMSENTAPDELNFLEERLLDMKVGTPSKRRKTCHEGSVLGSSNRL